MNRRSFIWSSAAGLALIGSRVVAQRGTTATTVEVSELTDAEIDFTESGFTLESHDFEPEAGTSSNFAWEQLVFSTGEGRLVLDLFTGGTQDFPKYMQEFTTGFDMLFGNTEHAYADLDEGGYSAFSYSDQAVYLEYQLGAFPDVDFMVTFSGPQANFQEEFAKVQTVMVGGAAPCLFTAESKVEDMVLAGTSQTPATTGTRNTRNTTTTGNTSQTTNTTTSAGGDPTEAEYVDMIVAHREQFLTSYDLFLTNLAVVGEETTTDAEKADLFEEMYGIALEWKAYPDDAMAPAVPASLTELSTLYVEWAQVIGEMGTLFEELYNGVDTIDAFIAAMSEWELLDAELEVALEEQGFQSFGRASGAIKSIRNGLHATWRSTH
jgi:hypothetical protein